MEQTVEEKWDYLLETKALIRNAIISKGQTITDDTPFRDYVGLILAIKTSEDLETQLNAQDAVIAQQQARITELENIIAGFTA